MTKRGLMGKLASLGLLLIANSCGIDVGNPHGVTSDQGNLSIAIADAPTDNARHVYLYLASLSVIPLGSDNTEGTPVPVTLNSSGKIDVLALQGGKSLDLSLAQTLPAGNYSGIILGLEESQPSVLVDQNGQEKPVPIADNTHEIRVYQAFVVSASQDLALTLHLDLRRSIKQGNDQNFAFEPFASLGRKDQEASIRGTVSPEATEVCAYVRRERAPNDGDRLQPPGSNRPQSNREARQPPSIDPDGNFEKIQDDSSCASAFASESVTDGQFLLAHLWPGDYQLIFFKADGTKLNQYPAPVKVLPGQTVEFPAGNVR